MCLSITVPHWDDEWMDANYAEWLYTRPYGLRPPCRVLSVTGLSITRHECRPWASCFDSDSICTIRLCDMTMKVDKNWYNIRTLNVEPFWLLNIPQEELKIESCAVYIAWVAHGKKTSRCLAMWHYSRTGSNSQEPRLNLKFWTLSPGLSRERVSSKLMKRWHFLPNVIYSFFGISAAITYGT